MALYVQTNVSSLNAQRKLTNATNSLNVSYQRLASGLRINSSKDDAAGLQISDRLTSQINGLNQGNRNTNDGIALAQTMEGALDETSSMLQKIRTLAVQSANGTNTTEDRAALKKEANALMAEVTRIAEQTKFGGKTILKGTTKGAIFNTAAQQVSNKDGKLTLQVGANKGDEISFDVSNFMFSFIVSRADGQTAAKGWSKTNGVLLSTAETSKEVITLMDKMIADVDKQRSGLGAIQNRLESSIRNQSNVAANQADARSRIRDADFAEESAALSQQSIIQQAATSMLMQANSRPQLALSMLG